MRNNDFHFYKFLKENNYPITYDTFSKNINSHPDYPSLLAYSETFNFLGVENLAAQVPKEEYDNIPDTFIALIKEDDSNKFVYVKKVSKDEVIIHFNKSKKKLSLNNFFNIWDGIVLAIDPNEKEVTNNDSKITTIKKSIYIILLFLFCLFVLFSELKTWTYINIFLSIIGFTLAVFSTREELGFEDDQIQKICNSSENSSCNEVIKSKGGKIFSIFSLSDLAIAYFSTNFILNILTPNFYLSLSSLFLSIISLFIIGYSIYYQKFVIKRWCILCLGIVLVLLLQSLISILSYDKNYLYIPLISFSLFFLGLLTVWSSLKPFVLKSLQLNKTEIELLKIKRNKRIFDSLLTSSKTIENFNNLEAMKASSNSNLIGILSPSCGFCKKTFSEYKELNNNNISCNIIFNVNPDNKNNTYLKICYFIINEYNLKGYNHMIMLLDDWYKSSFEIDLWLKKQNYHSSLLDNKKVYNQLKNMFDWCQLNNINYTPATIYHNKIYPADLEVIDLKFFIE
ncbi:vitamin K epoxide reductase family protein [Empedobacter falsenii]|uniref:Vitamin K epoxide reductase domain-containing protein n=1 Tax=Empedobacter falsenii TaxID=343874 RepID=A0AAW7DN02_9FLAO|nr:vitamin K epoxide reductase family protein [Empedobacter falsenii]MDM1551671.1 hypothetical protein [Empedobacter falsenii]